MANVKDITRESWILNTFPEWGTWLNEEIEEEVVPKNNFAMWWLGNCGVWIKTPGGANIVMDLWSNRGKSTKKVKDMVWGHQMANMAGFVNYNQTCACNQWLLTHLPLMNWITTSSLTSIATILISIPLLPL